MYVLHIQDRESRTPQIRESHSSLECVAKRANDLKQTTPSPSPLHIVQLSAGDKEFVEPDYVTVWKCARAASVEGAPVNGWDNYWPVMLVYHAGSIMGVLQWCVDRGATNHFIEIAGRITEAIAAITDALSCGMFFPNEIQLLGTIGLFGVCDRGTIKFHKFENRSELAALREHCYVDCLINIRPVKNLTNVAFEPGEYAATRVWVDRRSTVNMLFFLVVDHQHLIAFFINLVWLIFPFLPPPNGKWVYSWIGCFNDPLSYLNLNNAVLLELANKEIRFWQPRKKPKVEFFRLTETSLFSTTPVEIRMQDKCMDAVLFAICMQDPTLPRRDPTVAQPTACRTFRDDRIERLRDILRHFQTLCKVANGDNTTQDDDGPNEMEE